MFEGASLLGNQPGQLPTGRSLGPMAPDASVLHPPSVVPADEDLYLRRSGARTWMPGRDRSLIGVYAVVTVGISGNEADGTGVGRSCQPDEEVDRVDALLGGGPDRTHDPALGGGSSPGSVGSPHLAVHDGRPDGLLAPPVGGVDVGVVEEGEEGVGFGGEVLDQPAVGVVGVGYSGEQLDPLSEVTVDGPALASYPM